MPAVPPITNRIQSAQRLLDRFSKRTGLAGTGGDPARRYLWTDAFAVQAFFGLARILEEPAYHERARQLIDLVHGHLGAFHPDDEREGWISGLPEAEARRRPTAGGLRIGKELPEREKDDAFDDRLEWQRDGQYFHYLTRWYTALLRAAEETGEPKYARWAAEGMLAARSFLYQSKGRPRMYWKMSTDLSRPLVSSMGAHDPLEGLICIVSAQQAAPTLKKELQPLREDFRAICTGNDWWTSDALGIGGLLLNTLRAILLVQAGAQLPASARPEKLRSDSLYSLQNIADRSSFQQPAERRLAFRECGLTLGLRALHGGNPLAPKARPDLSPLDAYLPLADNIESFWLEPDNQAAASWTGHLDINAVTLAASLIAGEEPEVFA